MSRSPILAAASLALTLFAPAGTTQPAHPSATRVLTVTDGAADPAVSPDGSQIAVSILGRIWLVPAGGGDARQVSQGISWDSHPAWFPDGRFLAYSHELPNGNDIVIANLATGTSSVLYHVEEHQIGQIEVSPKGGDIFFVQMASQYDAHVMRIPTSGGVATPITEARNWHEWSFALSPDATHMVVASGRYGGANLYRIDLPDRHASRVTATPRNQFSVAWSPDAKTVYYIESVNATDNVMARALAGGQARTVFSSPYDDKALALFPDGKAAVLCAGRKLYRLDLTSGAAQPIAFEARFTRPAPARGDMIITHAKLWDGTGAAPKENVTIEIRDGRVASIRPGTGGPLPAGIPIVDATGRTVMPGLMDNHYHYWWALQGADLITRGITTIRDPGAPLSMSLNFKEAIALGLVAGPDIYTAGPLIDGPGDYHPMVDVMLDDPASAATLVRSLKAQGVDLLKVYFLLDPAVLCAVVKEAHAVGLRVTGHIGVHTSWDRAIDCGIDGLNHIRLWADFLPASEQPQGENESLDGEKNMIPRMQADWREIDPESSKATAMIRKMAASGLGFDPTLSVQEIPDGLRKSLALDQFAIAKDSYRRMGRFVARAQQGGVRLLAGTDDGSLFDELEAYAAAGIPNAEILKAATGNGAAWLGRQTDFGTIAPGRRASLLIIEGDPLKDVKDLRKIDVVIKDGRVVFEK
jgi:imidazolonepropionase-like amidohydrolase